MINLINFHFRHHEDSILDREEVYSISICLPSFLCLRDKNRNNQEWEDKKKITVVPSCPLNDPFINPLDSRPLKIVQPRVHNWYNQQVGEQRSDVKNPRELLFAPHPQFELEKQPIPLFIILIPRAFFNYSLHLLAASRFRHYYTFHMRTICCRWR